MAHTMKLNRSIALQREAVGFVLALWQRAEQDGSPQSAVTDEWLQWKSDRLVSHNAPRWLVMYCDGVMAGLRELYSRRLVHCYLMPDGQLYSSHSQRHNYYQKADITPREVYEDSVSSGLYWDTPTGLKPFFTVPKPPKSTGELR